MLVKIRETRKVMQIINTVKDVSFCRIFDVSQTDGKIKLKVSDGIMEKGKEPDPASFRLAGEFTLSGEEAGELAGLLSDATGKKTGDRKETKEKDTVRKAEEKTLEVICSQPPAKNQKGEICGVFEWKGKPFSIMFPKDKGLLPVFKKGDAYKVIVAVQNKKAFYVSLAN